MILIVAQFAFNVIPALGIKKESRDTRMRDEQHYRGLLAENPNSAIGVTLAASAVYAARYGVCEPKDHEEDWQSIVRRLQAEYGESMDVEQILHEMEQALREPEGLAILAARFGLEHAQLRHAVHDGRLPARKAGNSWLSSAADVQAALDSGTLQRRPGRPSRR